MLDSSVRFVGLSSTTRISPLKAEPVASVIGVPPWSNRSSSTPVAGTRGPQGMIDATRGSLGSKSGRYAEDPKMRILYVVYPSVKPRWLGGSDHRERGGGAPTLKHLVQDVAAPVTGPVRQAVEG